MMSGFSTMTQKGQVAIPKSIRDHFQLKPSDRIHFFIENNRIVARPVLSTAHMRGFIKAKKPLSKSEMKKIIEESVLEKYNKKLLAEK